MPAGGAVPQVVPAVRARPGDIRGRGPAPGAGRDICHHGTFTTSAGRRTFEVGTTHTAPCSPLTWMTCVGVGVGDGSAWTCATGTGARVAAGGKMLFHGTMSSASAMTASTQREMAVQRRCVVSDTH
jgi:hypothetical protein